MGYEIKVFFVDSSEQENRKPYLRRIGMLNMGKIAYGKVGKLLGKLEKKAKKKSQKAKNCLSKYEDICEELNALIDKFKFGVGSDVGDPKASINKCNLARIVSLIPEKCKVEFELEKYYSFIWITGDEKEFTDCYGVPLMICGIEEFLSVVKYDNAKQLKEGNNCRTFSLFIKMCEELQSDRWSNMKLVLYGH